MDTVDAFVQRANQKIGPAIAAMFWHYRHANPSFAIEVTEADILAFRQCCEYLEVSPTIKVFRPGGIPAQEPIPAQGKRRAVPGRAAIPPKNVAVIQMVDVQGNSFVPVENNEADLQKGQDFARLRRIKERAGALAAQLQSDLQANTTSNSTILEAVEALRALSA